MDLHALLEWIPFPGFPRDNLDAWSGLTPEERSLLQQHMRRRTHATAFIASDFSIKRTR